MIDSEFPIELAGVRYRIAEDGEGPGYNMTTPTVRAPNTQIVQGDDPGQVNLDPSTMLWTLEDWSSGEGDLKTGDDNGRSQTIHGLNFYGRPGEIFSGYRAWPAIANGGGANFSTLVSLVVAMDTVYALELVAGNPYYYTFNKTTLQFSARQTFAGVTNGIQAVNSLCGDNNALFFHEQGGDNIYTWPGSGAPTLLNNQLGGHADSQMVELGDYLYILQSDGKMYEISKTTVNTTTAETPILDLSSNGTFNNMATNLVTTVGDNRVYVMAVWNNYTSIYEIIPTTAATTGYGRELTKIHGLKGETIWAHGGFVYWIGTDMEPDGNDGPRRLIYYWQPGQSRGTLGEVRTQLGIAPGSHATPTAGASRLNTWAFALEGVDEDFGVGDDGIGLWEVDALSGGFGQVGGGHEGGVNDFGEGDCLTLIYHDGFYLASYQDVGASYGVWTWDTGRPSVNTQIVTSPEHDFGISGEKVLQSIEVRTNEMPVGGSVQLAYSVDGGAFQAVSPTHNTDGDAGLKWVVSTDSATVTFRGLRIKMTIVNSADQVIVKAVDVRASANSTFQKWQLLLDVSDETSPRGYNGAKLIDKLQALVPQTVVSFKDGYTDRNPGAFDEYDVIVEEVFLDLDRPGEGTAIVILREVI